MYKFRWANLAHHDKFKHLINRDINPRKVEELCRSVRKYGFLQPVVCTATGGIVDGQHRVEVSRILGIPVPYDIIEGMTDEQATEIVIEMNNKRHDWTVMNYIEANFKAGEPAFVGLKEQIDNWSTVTYDFNDETFSKTLSPSSMALLYWDRDAKGNSPLQKIKKGGYVFDSEFGEQCGDLLVDMLEAVGGKYYSITRLIRACRMVLQNWDNQSPTGVFEPYIIKHMVDSGSHLVRAGLESAEDVLSDWRNAHILYRSQQTK